nr:turripeptide Pal9.2-like [Procambarus clarkii]
MRSFALLTLLLVLEAECSPHKCTKDCELDLKLVCGTDGQTYTNACILESSSCLNPDKNLKVDYEGKCRDNDCLLGCSFHLDPVCGTDGNSYPNSCVLEATACLKPQLNLKIAKKGLCKSS